jgi:cellulose synthase/poly-beta-1,6-N-acetylglucosamine synthase-like glycosyltransferase
MGAGVAEGVLAAVLATLACLLLAHRTSPTSSRHGRGDAGLVRAVAPLLPIVASIACLAPWAPLRTLVASGVGLWLLTLPWLPVTRRWDLWAHAAWSLTVVAGAFYIVTMAAWTVASGLSWTGLVGGWTLWVLELVAWLLVLAHGWEIFDALGSRHWERRRPAVSAVLPSQVDAPFVSIHVPTHNEPPDLVIQTLESLRGLDYPNVEVLVLDNNTDDEELWLPVARYCAMYPWVLKFHRLVEWPGYKSGALNYGEDQADPRASLIAVVDADYLVEPNWLHETVGAFADPEVGFVQTPQDYRDWNHSGYFRHLYYSYEYFFAVSQQSRDERNSAIFGGTMGLVRRTALRDVGRWDESCLTEDAELSLRLLEAGWTGHHLDRSSGHGVMPLTFDALKRQRFRGCFGGMQILKRHWRALMPWSRSSRLSLSQRLAHLSGGLQWFGDLLGLMFAAVMAAGLLDLAFGDGLVVRRLNGLLLLAVPALIALGAMRAIAAVKTVGRGVSSRDTLGIWFIWLSLGWVGSIACIRGLLESKGGFLRTPTVRGDVRWFDAMRANPGETLLAISSIASAAMAIVLTPRPVTLLVSALLVVPVAGWLAAPVHSLAALRTDLPEPLRRRRSAERSRGWWRPGRRAMPLASMLGTVAVAGLLVLVIQPGSQQSPRQPAGSFAGPSATSSPTATTTTSTSTGVTSTTTTTASATTTTRTPTPLTTAPAAPSSSSSSSSSSTPRPSPSRSSPTTNPGRSPTTKPH